jgi:serine/threonine-protein kinase haspin
VAGALAKLRLGTPASKAKAKAAAAAAAPPADDAAPASAVDPPMTRLLKLAAHPPAAPLPSMDAALGRHVTLAGSVKVGEGSFGEAYRTGDGAVVKVVPFVAGDPPPPSPPASAADVKTAADVAAEAEVGLALTSLADDDGEHATAGFAATRAVAVCRGAYSPTLAAEWRAWRETHISHNADPSACPPDQLHAIFVCADGGADLEAASVPSEAAALSILAQATLALAAAERAACFEHRDLHWGNVLVREVADGVPPPSARVDGRAHVVSAHAGVRVSLIDFTLARIAGEGAGSAAWADLDADPAIFEGAKGDLQADTYRRMRKAVHKAAAAAGDAGGDPWRHHVPSTNALWLAYLAGVLVEGKAYGASDAHVKAVRAFRRRAGGAAGAAALVGDVLFKGVVTVE